MPVYDIGGGGSPASTRDDNDELALDKPYDLYGDPTADMVQRLDEMLSGLYLALKRASSNAAQRDITLTQVGSRLNTLESDTGGSSDVGLNSVTKTITHSQILSLNDTPVEIIPAPSPSSTIIFPLAWSIEKPTWGTAYGANATLRVRYAGAGSDVLSTLVGILNQTAKQFKPAIGGPTDYTTNLFHVGTAIQLSANVNNTSGDAANKFYVHMWYATVTSLL